MPTMLLVLSVLLPALAGSGGKVFLTQEEALALAFPKCRIEKITSYLDEKQIERAAELARGEVGAGIVRAYRAFDEKGVFAGTAYFDRHRVRTLPELLMIVVDPRGRVARVEVLAFAEPLDYLPKAAWYGEFAGRKLDEELALKRGLHHPAGATLTAQATTAAVRRVLALHQVLHGPLPPAAGTNA